MTIEKIAIQTMAGDVHSYLKTITKLEAINAELLVALEAVIAPNGHYHECLAGKGGSGECSPVCKQTRAAIAKARSA